MQNNLIQKFFESKKTEATELLSDLIRFPSLSGTGEAEIQDFLADKFTALGLSVKKELLPETIKEHPAYSAAAQELDYRSRPNLYASLPSENKESVILCAHSDVVPAADWPDAFQPKVEGDRVIGRGAADDKGHLVTIYFALLALKELKLKSKKNVEVQAVIEEEVGGNGALAAIISGHKADGVIVLESTDLTICPANRGAVWYRIEVTGKPVHMGRIREGVNAIEKMAEIIKELRRYEEKLIAESDHPLFREYQQPVQVNVGIIKGGDWPSTVAGWAEMEGGVGFLPNKRLEQVQEELRALLANFPDTWIKEHSRISFPKLRNDAYETPVNDPIVTDLAKAVGLSGLTPKVTGFIVSCDARLYNRVGKMPTVVFGAGSIRDAHSRGESISITEVLKASEVLTNYLIT
ncbi:MAG: ArgE/DapE family deacylase [Candidatus Omnitrophica bacterium]|nr:ArgE/DapE family deacylase [Candidatus Omnitrophota bacterium]